MRFISFISVILLIQATTCLDSQSQKQQTRDSSPVELMRNISLLNKVVPRNREVGIFIKKLRLRKDIFKSEHFQFAEEIFKERHELNGKYSFSELAWMGLTTKAIASPYSDLQTHRYDNFKDLKESGGPHVDQEVCLKQLTFLSKQVADEYKLGYKTKNINFHFLLDTYGRAPAGLLKGDLFWTGDYEQCLQVKIELPVGSKEQTKTRYCVASLKLKDWPQEQPLSDYIGIRTGICIPKACDSMNYKNKFSLLKDLIHFNFKTVDKELGDVTDLYCLPDENSNLRVWWRASPTTTLTVLFGLVWFAVLAYSTLKYTKLDYKEDVKCAEQLTNNNDEKPKLMKVYRALSVHNNLKALLRVGEKKKEPSDESLKEVVDLRLVEGIKVMCMCYIITGHVLMCIGTILKNGTQFANSYSIPYHSANMAPAFAVNSFFSITGILTAYLTLKHNQKHNFILKPTKWVALVLHRYLRLIPTYLIVVLYTKSIAKYTSSGPLWDYATSAQSQRKICEQESWLLTLLFAANTKSPIEQCIPSAWYLANDFQFMLVTPFFVALLYKYPQFGKRFIKLLICLGFLANFLNLFMSDLDDLRPIAGFKFHGFKVYVNFMHSNYVKFQYRYPAYFCGLLIGFALYNYELRKRRYLEGLSKETEARHSELEEEPKHSEYLLKYCTKCSLAFILICASTPFIARFIPFNKFAARLLAALFIPSYHLLYSLAVGIYILLASTGFGNKRINEFLSAPFWKPFSRVSICALLVNIEVINYIIQSNTQLWQIDAYVHSLFNIICIVAVYFVSALVYVLIEAPFQNLLAEITASIANIFRSEQKNKSD